MKRKTKAQWINLQRNSSPMNWTQFPLLCENSRAILLVLVGRTADNQTKHWAGGFGNFKNSLQIRFSRFAMVQCYYSVTNAFQLVFWAKYIRIL